MNLNFTPYFVIWGAMALAVIAMLFWRKSVASHEDDSLHVSGGEASSRQVAVAHKLEVIDKWGKTLTVVTVLFGLLLAALFVYQGWVQASTTTQGV